MKKSQSALPVFYETAHAELASALEMLAACKLTESPKQAFGYFMHAKDEYNHARSFFEMLSNRGKRTSIEIARKILSMPDESSYIVYDQGTEEIEDIGNWIKRDVEYLVRDMKAIIEQDRPNAIMIYIILLSLAAMGIFNAQTLSIFRRKKEIGTLMALGMKKRTVVLLFTIEGALNAILAIFLTIILFGPLLYYYNLNGIPLPIDYSDMGLIISKTLMPVYSPILLIATAIIVTRGS
mgnify:CR=1 FL=1